ncbi:MAG: type II secretion system minor pseudopilin GspK [Gallionellaceae bacterium]|jgi:general secretion pathway protein K
MKITSYKQNGVAIIMVMLIVAISSTLAVYISQQQNFWQRQIETQFDRTQARRLGLTGIDWARGVLADDLRANAFDHETELWTMRLPAMPVENGEVIGLIEDRQGRFNLNSIVKSGLTSPADLAKLQRLLSLLDLPVELADALADWIDLDAEIQIPGGVEDAYYLGLSRPYRAANRPLVEFGELARVKGFTPQIMNKLQPFVVVLPISGALNVNFISAEVLTAISNMSLSDARLVVQQRRGKPFTTVAEFKQHLPNPAISIEDADLAVSSNFFWITGQASVNNSQVITQALVHRNQGWPKVIWQSVQ